VTDLSRLPLGGRPKLEDARGRTLQLPNYVAPSAIAPNGLDLTRGETEFGAMLNNTLGCCGIAAPGHIIQLATLNSHGSMFTVSDAEILRAYQDVGGYVPGDPSTDRGTYMLDVLKYWRTTGIGAHAILAFAEFDPKDERMRRYANTVFGSTLMAIALPKTAQRQAVWDLVSTTGDGAPASWGRHAVCDAEFGMDPDREHDGKVVTWGQLQPYTLSFRQTYCYEAYAVVTNDWLNTRGRTITGLDVDRLLRDLEIVTAPPPSRTPTEARQYVAALARSYLGRSDAATFWKRVGVAPPGPPFWCGGFAAAVLNEALGCAIRWRFATKTDKRSGFLYLLGSPRHTPELGDVCYVDEPYQHHAVVVRTDPLELVNGNGKGGVVALSGAPTHTHVFYSIARLL
jgi:hypothetical protein